ncbi:hypothetical protein ABLG96_13785 [Nakamurella sp. A5-74]|uniref:Helix-turn-helix domain-containing protein n=1 Tax=Nakamurella sp. A5-74 TaxID=3158264 RepID=A0AAU8DLY7_9ACTN
MAGRNPQQKATPRTIAATQKQALAVRLRLEGHSYEQIAQRAGYADRGSAYRAVETGRKAILAEPAEALRDFELDRLDAMLRAANDIRAGAAEAGEPELQLKAIDRLLRIVESRRKLLGLDAPTKTDVTGWDGGVTVVFDQALNPDPNRLTVAVDARTLPIKPPL